VLEAWETAALGKTSQSGMHRVVSRDGIEIAYRKCGHGPPLVVVHGVAADHTRWGPLLPYLEPHFTIYAMDRRGRGESGDGPDYELAQEFGDVAAVVDAVAEGSGSLVDVYGHSHGGFCAFGAATLTSNIRRLVLYEGWPLPDPTIYALPGALEDRMDALLAAGDREGVVETLFRQLLQMSGEDLAAFKAAESWPRRVAAAHTITREIRGESAARLEPEVAATITVPVLLVTGKNSDDPAKTHIRAVAEALPNARVVDLDSGGHVADVLAPKAFAAHLISWLREVR
jgi:pimeloyl-ACP methyl ester carboxylesterase